MMALQKLYGLLTLFVVALLFVAFAESASAPATNPRLYWGYYTANSYESNFRDQVYGLKQKLGRNPAIVHWFMNFGENLASSTITEVRKNQSVALVTWQAFYGVGTLKQIINGSKDSVINKFIDQVLALKQPFFLRPGHEMNGNWYPWSEQYAGNSVGDFAKFWRYLWNKFEARGANVNVTWVWNPNIGTYPGVGYANISKLYPGSKYVDWAGINCFNFGTANNYMNMSAYFKPTYDALQTFTTKPILLGEIAASDPGNTGTLKSGWIYDALQVQLVKNFPRVKGFVWFNALQSNDWRVDSSSKSLSTFKAAINNGHYVSSFGTALTGKIKAPKAV